MSLPRAPVGGPFRVRRPPGDRLDSEERVRAHLRAAPPTDPALLDEGYALDPSTAILLLRRDGADEIEGVALRPRRFEGPRPHPEPDAAGRVSVGGASFAARDYARERRRADAQMRELGLASNSRLPPARKACVACGRTVAAYDAYECECGRARCRPCAARAVADAHRAGASARCPDCLSGWEDRLAEVLGVDEAARPRPRPPAPDLVPPWARPEPAAPPPPPKRARDAAIEAPRRRRPRRFDPGEESGDAARWDVADDAALDALLGTLPLDLLFYNAVSPRRDEPGPDLNGARTAWW